MRDITAGSGSCAWRSLGELQVMNGLEGIADRACEAFVICAMEDKRKGSMQSVGLWSSRTEGHIVLGVLWVWKMCRSHGWENCCPRMEYDGSPWAMVEERPCLSVVVFSQPSSSSISVEGTSWSYGS